MSLPVPLGGPTVKFGGDFTREKVADFGYTTFGEYRFAPGPPRPDEKYLDFTQKFGLGFVRYGQTLASAFAQDNWRVASRACRTPTPVASSSSARV